MVAEYVVIIAEVSHDFSLEIVGEHYPLFKFLLVRVCGLGVSCFEPDVEAGVDVSGFLMVFIFRQLGAIFGRIRPIYIFVAWSWRRLGILLNSWFMNCCNFAEVSNESSMDFQCRPLMKIGVIFEMVDPILGKSN